MISALLILFEVVLFVGLGTLAILLFVFRQRKKDDSDDHYI